LTEFRSGQSGQSVEASAHRLPPLSQVLPVKKPKVRSRAIQPGDIEAGARFAQKRSVPRYPFAALALIVEPLTGTEIAAISELNRKIGLDQLPTRFFAKR